MRLQKHQKPSTRKYPSCDVLLLHNIIIVDNSNQTWYQNSLLRLKRYLKLIKFAMNKKGKTKKQTSNFTSFHFPNLWVVKYLNLYKLRINWKKTFTIPIWFQTISAPLGQLIFGKHQTANLGFIRREEMLLMLLSA